MCLRACVRRMLLRCRSAQRTTVLSATRIGTTLGGRGATQVVDCMVLQPGCLPNPLKTTVRSKEATMTVAKKPKRASNKTSRPAQGDGQVQDYSHVRGYGWR